MSWVSWVGRYWRRPRDGLSPTYVYGSPPNPPRQRRWLLKLAAALITLAAVAALATKSTAVQDMGMRAIVESRVGRSVGGVLGDDALHVIVCGSGSPLPAPGRAQACIAVFAGGRGYVFDVGTGAAGNLANWRAPSERIQHVFLTHFHSDHFGDLGELNLQGWVAGRGAPLVVHGPPGVERVVNGLQEAYALDRAYRTAHHGEDLMNPAYGLLVAAPFEASASAVVVHQDGELTIRSFLVDHSPVAPSVGYRIDYRGRSVVISGDTAPSPSLVAAAEGADLMLHEALATHVVQTLEAVTREAGQPRLAKVMLDIPDYHTSPVDAARAANAAHVRRLVLYHLVPGPPGVGIAKDIFLRGVDDVREGVTLSSDGSVYSLPVGTTEIRERSL